MSNISARRRSAHRAGADDYEKKRNEVLRAAASVFKDLGYEAATADEIARRAGMDRASLYYYFKGKEELFREMIGGFTSENVKTVETLAATEMAPEAKLRAMIVAIFESYERHYPYVQIYLQEHMSRLVKNDSEWSRNIVALNHRFDVALTEIVKQGLDCGHFTSRGDAKLIRDGIIGMCNWSHRWFRIEGSLRGRDIAEIFADMVLGGLVKTPAAPAQPAKPAAKPAAPRRKTKA